MEKSVRTVYAPHDSEKVIEKSRFLTYSTHVESEEEARGFIAKIRSQHSLATHVCYAFIADKTGNLQRFSDDGEPQGTAGVPILEVLKAKKLYETAVAVVRYFGGIKLGVPGLINAYKTAAREALDNATIIEKTIDEVYSVVFDYPLMNEVMRVLKDENIEQQNPKFELNCYLEISVRKKDADRVTDKLKRLYGVEVSYLRTV